MRAAGLSLSKSEATNQPDKMNTQNRIDLTSPAKAIAYLESLPADQAISLPGSGETTTDGDAVRAICGMSANEWANLRGQWEWTAGNLTAALRAEMEAANE
jgi:hypothetical protein